MAKGKRVFRRGKNSENRNPKQLAEVPISAVVYSGPIRTLNEKDAKATHTVTISASSTVTSTAGGVINNVVSNSPIGFPEWAGLAALFQEYRILGIELHYSPVNKYSKTTTVCYPVIGVIDRESIAPLTSYNEADSYSSARFLSLEQDWTMKAKMCDHDEAQFYSTSGGPAKTIALKFYSTNLSLSTAYGMFFWIVRVQFKNMGI